MAMTAGAIEARRKYYREYRAKNRRRYNAYSKTWRENNPEKIRMYKKRYWEKKAASVDGVE